MTLFATLILATTLQLPSPAQQPPADVLSQARAILAAIVANDFAKVEEQFTDDMKAALPSGQLAAAWAKLLNQAGASKSCGTNPRVRSIADKQMVITPCEFERANIDIQFAFDYQVTSEEFARWKTAIGSRPDVTFHSYPALNHLFIAGTGPSLPAEYEVPGHVAEEVVRDIAAWILSARR